MGWYEEPQKTFRAAAGQITSSGHTVPTKATPRKDALYFTKNAHAKMKGWGISEADVYDVYYHGSLVKENTMVRKYNGYELGIWFSRDHLTEQAIISSIWKRGRR